MLASVFIAGNLLIGHVEIAHIPTRKISSFEAALAGRPALSRSFRYAISGIAGHLSTGDKPAIVSAKVHVPRGLAELVGSRVPLSQGDPDAAIDSVSWTPAAPWLSGRNLTSLLPTCLRSDPGDCDASYSDETTAAVQTALWESQNPADCENVRYLVLDQSWPSGLGSSLRIHMFMLGLAIRCVIKRANVFGDGRGVLYPTRQPASSSKLPPKLTFFFFSLPCIILSQ